MLAFLTYGKLINAYSKDKKGECRFGKTDQPGAMNFLVMLSSFLFRQFQIVAKNLE